MAFGSAEEDARIGAALTALLGPDVKLASSADEAVRARVRFVEPDTLTSAETSGADLVVTGADLIRIAQLVAEHPGLNHVITPSLIAGRGTALVPRIVRHLLLGGGGPAALVEGAAWVMRSAAQLEEVLDAVEAAAARFGAPEDRRVGIRAVVRELLDNAVHACFGAHAPDRDVAPARERVCRVVIGSIGATFLVSVTDACGTLERAHLAESFSRGVLSETAPTSEGSAPGLWRVARAVQHLLVRVEPGEATEIVVGFDLTTAASKQLRSLHLLVEPATPHAVQLEAPPEAEPTLLEGRYELLDLISSGGMGSVYRARHRHLDRLVAVKVIRGELRDDPSLRRHFFAEARVASSLVHPHIVGVTDFGIDPALGYFLVMELLRGDTLRARMSAQAVGARVACDVLEQVTWALRYIHAHGIVHCDLKPDNIFLAQLPEEPRRRNHAKLIDFGLAFRVSGPATYLGGTPPYLAPERLTGAPPSAQADIYSLGTIFYELVTGRRPYEGSVTEIVSQQLGGKVPRLPSTISTEPLEPRADDLIMRALSRDPRARQASAEAFLFELRTLMSMMGMRVRRVARAAGGTRLGASAVPRREVTVSIHPRQLRAHPRVELRAPVVLRGAGAEYQGVTENVSEGGVFVMLAEALPVGLELSVTISGMSGAAPAHARAVVRWSRRGAGCGLAWVEPSSSLWARIERLRAAHRE